MHLNIRDIVKNNYVKFSLYRKGYLYYDILLDDGRTFTFPVPLDDIGDATFLKTHKAITLMRYIRQAIDDGTFIEKKG